MLTATAYDSHVEQLFQRVQQLHTIFTRAGIEYRIVGGLAVFIHVVERDPLLARITADVDAGVWRQDLDRIIEAARQALPQVLQERLAEVRSRE